MRVSKNQIDVSKDFFLYEKIASDIKELINSDTLKFGDKLPSVRSYSEKNNTSISSVLKAYRVLEDEGLIEAKIKSGYFIKRKSAGLYPKPKIISFTPSANNVNIYDAYSDLADKLVDKEMIQFGTAVPNLEYFPVKKLNSIIVSIVRKHPEFINQYSSPKGFDELVYQISKKAFESGNKLSEQEIIITNGCTEAINLCLRAVTGPRDTIIVESPTFYGFLEIAESLKLKIIEVPADPETGISLEKLNDVIKKNKTKALLINPNFQNPLGHCIPDENKKELLSMLSKKGIPIIEDDIYSDLFGGDLKPKNIKSFDKENNVLLCSSFSKSTAPGYRVGYTAASKYYLKVKKYKLSTSYHTNLLSQMVINEFMKNGGYELHLRKLRTKYKEQVLSYLNLFAQNLPEGSKISRPAGGYVLWIELPGKVDTIELYKKVLADKITISPGKMFSTTNKYQHCFRINCAFPINDKTTWAINKICTHIKNLY